MFKRVSRFSWPRAAVVVVTSWACAACVLDLQKDMEGAPTGASPSSSGSTRTSERATSAANGCGDESRSNDTPETATPVKLGVPVPACIGDKDVDFYLVKVPTEDRAGGYFQVSVTDVGETGLAIIQATVDTDKAPLITNDFGDHRGGPTFGFWTGAPGQTYRVSVAQFSNWVQPWDYTLQIDYTPIGDAYEPNDTRDDAQPITLGETVEGFVFAGHAAGPIKPGEWDDWYEVELTPGNVTMKVTSFPRDALAEFGLLDPSGVSIRPGPQPYAANRGADHTASAKIATAGTYKLRLGVFSTPPATSGKADVSQSVPDSYTRPYQLMVTQP